MGRRIVGLLLIGILLLTGCSPKGEEKSLEERLDEVARKQDGSIVILDEDSLQKPVMSFDTVEELEEAMNMGINGEEAKEPIHFEEECIVQFKTVEDFDKAMTYLKIEPGAVEEDKKYIQYFDLCIGEEAVVVGHITNSIWLKRKDDMPIEIESQYSHEIGWGRFTWQQFKANNSITEDEKAILSAVKGHVVFRIPVEGVWIDFKKEASFIGRVRL